MNTLQNKILSIIFKIIIILVICLIIFLGFSFYKRDQSQTRIRELDKKRAELLDLTFEQILALKNEMQFNAYQYSPWVSFIERPRSGQYVNIVEDNLGYRKTPNIPLNKPDSTKLFFFGGSTTFGYNVADWQTIPYYLQEILNSQSAHQNIEVRNYGHAYYWSKQELSLLIQLLLNGQVPKYVVFLDGINEGQINPAYSNEQSELFSSIGHPLALFKIATLNMLTKIPIFNELLSVKNLRLIRYSPQVSFDLYQKTRVLIRNLSSRYGFKVIFALQPIPGYKNSFQNHQLLDKEINPELQQYLSVFDQNFVDNITDSVSFTDMLSSYQGQPFIDNFHYTPKVNQMIAENVYKKLSEFFIQN